MSVVHYRLVLEGLVPEADDQRVRSFLQRIYGSEMEAISLPEVFPREVPGHFDFQRASEWMQALARAGVRSRVEIKTEQNLSATTSFVNPGDDLQNTTIELPHQLWLYVWSKPELAFRWVNAQPNLLGICFGLTLIALGNVLSYPGELWLMKNLLGDGLQAASTGRLLASLIAVEPIFRLLIEALFFAMLIRITGHTSSIAGMMALLGAAHVADPIKAIPVLGWAFALLAFTWFAFVGITAVYDLSRKRAILLILAPIGLMLISVASIVLLLVLLAGNLASSDLSNLSTQFAF